MSIIDKRGGAFTVLFTPVIDLNLTVKFTDGSSAIDITGQTVNARLYYGDSDPKKDSFTGEIVDASNGESLITIPLSYFKSLQNDGFGEVVGMLITREDAEGETEQAGGVIELTDAECGGGYATDTAMEVNATEYTVEITANDGLRGAQGEQGIQGVQGEQGSPGSIETNFQGVYSSSETYQENEIVRDGGYNWIALGETTGNAPPTYPTTSNENWEIFYFSNMLELDSRDETQWPYTERSEFYAPWAISGSQYDIIPGQFEYLYVLKPEQYIGLHATPAPATQIGPRWRMLTTLRESDELDLYPWMVVGNKTPHYPSMRSVIMGPWAGSNTYQISTAGAFVNAYSPLVVQAGMTNEPVFSLFAAGERAARGLHGYGDAAVGTQSMLEASSYLGAWVGRRSFFQSAGIFSCGIGGELAFQAVIERSTTVGTRSSYQARVNESTISGERAAYRGNIERSDIGGRQIGEGSRINRSVVRGYSIDAKDVDRTVLLGNNLTVGGALTPVSFNADTMEFTHTDTDGRPQPRILLPSGTIAANGWSAGEYIPVDYNPSGLTRPWQKWNVSQSANLEVYEEGGNEYLLIGKQEEILGRSRFRQTADRPGWNGSGINDAIPPSYVVHGTWSLGGENGKRDVVLHNSVYYLWIEDSRDVVQTAAMEPGVGADWDDFWQVTGTEGTFSLTFYDRISGAIAIGDNTTIQTGHDDAIVLGRGGTSKGANIASFGPNIDEIYVDAGQGVLFDGATSPFVFFDEGSWTPEFKGATTDPVMTYNLQEGTWQRINDVWRGGVNLRSTGITTAGAGALSISGPSGMVAEGTQGFGVGIVQFWGTNSNPAGLNISDGASDFAVYGRSGSDARSGMSALAANTALSGGAAANVIRFRFEVQA